MNFLLIGLGGGLGAIARYSLSLAIQARSWGAFATGTLLINLIGCLAIGLLAPVVTEFWSDREELRLAVIVGFLGGFTTFSSYAFEALRLWQEGDRLHAMLVVVLSNVVGLAVAWFGFFVSQKWLASGAA